MQVDFSIEFDDLDVGMFVPTLDAVLDQSIILFALPESLLHAQRSWTASYFHCALKRGFLQLHAPVFESCDLINIRINVKSLCRLEIIIIIIMSQFMLVDLLIMYI